MQNVSDMQQEAEAFVKNRRKTLFEAATEYLDNFEEYLTDNVSITDVGLDALHAKLLDVLTLAYFIINEGDLK